MAGKEFREVRKRLGDEPADASPYVGFARGLLGELKEDMRYNRLQQGVRRREIDGVLIEAISIFGQDEIRITPLRRPRAEVEMEDVYEKVKFLRIVGEYNRGADGSMAGMFYVDGGKGSEAKDISYNGEKHYHPEISDDGRVAAYAVDVDGGYNLRIGRYVIGGEHELCPETSWSSIRGMNSDGSVIVGVVEGVGASYGLRWDYETGAVTWLNPPPGYTTAICTAVSGDGRVMVGGATYNVGTLVYSTGIPCIWRDGATEAEELTRGGYYQAYTTSVSHDGRVVVGHVRDDTMYYYHACIWVDGEITVIGPPMSRGRDVSADGKIVHGDLYNETWFYSGVFRWTEEDGLVSLSTRRNLHVNSSTAAGDVFVGSVANVSGDDETPFYWVNDEDGEQLITKGVINSLPGCVATDVGWVEIEHFIGQRPKVR